jgi:uncharacterized protein
MLHHLLLIPSLACPTKCNYCFGPRQNSPPMALEVLDATLNWACEMPTSKPCSKFEVVFHGGEPLIAGAEFLRAALCRLRKAFGIQRLQMGMQSNFWLLRDERRRITLENCRILFECSG